MIIPAIISGIAAVSFAQIVGPGTELEDLCNLHHNSAPLAFSYAPSEADCIKKKVIEARVILMYNSSSIVDPSQEI